MSDQNEKLNDAEKSFVKLKINGVRMNTTDCKELFSIFTIVGGGFISDFETNKGYTYPKKFTCYNLHEIHDKLQNFETSYWNQGPDEVIRYNLMRRKNIEPPEIKYSPIQDIRNMRFYIKFHEDVWKIITKN